MLIRNWFKRNLSAAKRIDVAHVVAAGKTPEPWVQIRIVSKDDGKNLHIKMQPDEALELGRQLQSLSTKII